MLKYKYKDYSHYVSEQRSGWKRKRNKVWARRENIEVIARQFLRDLSPTFGICHGARTGVEAQWFKEELPGCEVIATDIGDDEHVIQWDFNKRNEDWVWKAGFVYSNSFDHAYKLRDTMKVWYEQLHFGGLLILEYGKGAHSHDGTQGRKINPMDPIGVELNELVKKLSDWLTEPNGTPVVPVVVPLPSRSRKSGDRVAVVVRK